MPRCVFITCPALLVLASAGCQSPGGGLEPSPTWQLEMQTAVDPMAAATPSLPFLWEPALGGGVSFSPYRSDYVNRLGVLSFNMQHRNRPDELVVMADYLSDPSCSPEFILCQEVVFKRAGSRHNTAAVLAEQLGYHVRGTKRTSDREGLAILSRYPFVYYDERHLKARTSALLLGFRRVSVMGEFILPDLGRVRVVNVHFAYQAFEHHVRRKQLAETLAWIEEREQQVPADITVLGGDFNMTPTRKELALVRRAAPGFRDGNTRRPTRGPQGNPSQRLDYIFVASPDHQVRLVAERLLFKEGLWHKDGTRRFWLSDHVPLMHEYVFAPPAPALAGTAGPRDMLE